MMMLRNAELQSAGYCYTGRRARVMGDTSGDAWWSITAGMTDEGWMTVSSGGRKIVYTAGSHDYDLVEAPVTGGPARQLLTTSQWEGMPAWSPLNQQLVFTTKRRGPEEIWIKSRQEGWERHVVTAQDFPDDATKIFMGPIFSPDGQRIAHTRVSAAGAFVWISPVAGGAPTRVTSGPSLEWPPTWSPDGARLAFTRSGVFKTELVKVRFGSVDAPVVLTEFDDDYIPQWGMDHLSAPRRLWHHFAQREERLECYSRRNANSRSGQKTAGRCTA